MNGFTNNNLSGNTHFSSTKCKQYLGEPCKKKASQYKVLHVEDEDVHLFYSVANDNYSRILCVHCNELTFESLRLSITILTSLVE
jgi:hypothetical protein